MPNIVIGFCFDCSHGTAYSTNVLLNVNNLEIVKIGVAWTFDEDLNKFKCLIIHANEALQIPKQPLSTHAIQTLFVCGVAHNWMFSKTLHHSLNHWQLHRQLWWAMKFEENENNWKSWKEMGEGGQMWVGCSGTIPYAICKPKEMILGKTYQT